MMTIYLIELLMMILAFGWSLIHLNNLRKKGRLTINLSTIGIGISSLGYFLRMIYLVMPSRSVWGNIEPSAATLTNVFLVYSVLSLWLTTGTLAVGFWHDALTNTINPELKTRTKYFIVITSIIVFICTITGMILIFNRMIIQGSLCVLIPLFIVISLMIVYLVKIKRIKGNFSKSNQERKRWVERRMITLIVLWSIYLVGLIINPIIGMSGRSELQIVPSATYRLVEICIAPTLMAIFDTHLRSLKRFFGCFIDPDIESGRSSKGKIQGSSGSEVKSADSQVVV